MGSTITPNLTLIDSSLSDVEGNPIWGADPALVDIDADGDQDLFIGTFTDGYLKYYQNVGDLIQYAYLLINGNYLGSGTGEWCSPEFWDIDADGDYDLFIGDWYGRIWYCRNDGTAQQAQYTLVSSYWLNIDVTNYAIPEFADTDGDGDCDLWVGRDVYDLGPENTPGDVFYLENTGTPQLPQFQPIRTSNLTIDVGTANRMLISDFDASGTLDLVISNRDYLIFYSNYGTVAQPRFELITEDFLNGILPHGLALYDLDADSDQDMVTANGAISNGEITFYRNVGTAQNPLYEYSFLLQTPYTLGMVTLADMDADGDGDMLVAKAGGGLAYYQDLGTPQSPSFVLQTEDWQGLPAGRNPRFADMDLDGDFDLLTGFNLLGLVELWENVGTPQNAQMVLADSNFCQMQISSPKPSAGDLDNDGDVDLLVGSGDGGIYFFRNITGEVSAPPPVYRHPQAGLQISLGPNPANPFVVASFELRVASNMSLEVFDLLGRRVAELASGFHLPGEYRYVWDAGNRAAGMYIIRLKTPQQSLAEKLT
ncbi:MAG TPA: FG-GAP-like repeat-containing protein, partial [bacterium]